MNTETINGIRREYWITKCQRVCRFYIEGKRFEAATILQSSNIDIPTVWSAPDFSGSTSNARSVDGITTHIEALRQAAEVFEAWDKDTGKGIEK